MKRTRSKKPQKSRAIGIRLNLEEIAVLEKIRTDHDIPTNTLAIRVLLRRAGALLEPDPGVVAAWRKAGKALIATGNNLNQLARAANQGGIIWDKGDDAVLQELRKDCLKLAGLLGNLISSSRSRKGSSAAMKRIISTFGDGSAVVQMPAVHPGEILQEEFLTPLEMTSDALARRVCVPPEQITQITSQTVGISAEMALRLSRLFGTTPAFWLNLQQRHDLTQAGSDLAFQHALEAIAPVG